MTERQKARFRAELREAAKFFPAVQLLIRTACLIDNGQLRDDPAQMTEDHWDAWRETLHLR